MKIVIIGGTGFIGLPLTRRWVQDGHTVSVISRGRHKADLPAQVEYWRINRKDFHYLAKCFQNQSVDIVYDLAAYAPRDIIQAASIFRHGLQRYIFVSSAAVYGRGPARNLEESAAVAPIPWHDYGRNKLLAEQECPCHPALPYVIIRPAVVYGPRDSMAVRSRYFFHRFYHQIPLLIPGRLQVYNNHIYVDDLVSLLVAAAQAPVGRIYNAAAVQSFSLAEYLDTLAAVMAQPCPPLTVLGMNLEQFRQWQYVKQLEFYFNAFDDFTLNVTRACQELKWTPRYNLARGLAATWQWLWQEQRAIITSSRPCFELEKRLCTLLADQRFDNPNQP